MGFRNGAYAKVWEIQPKTDRVTTIRISTSRKDKSSGGYISDFSGYCSCLGEAPAKAAKALHEGDSIKLGEVETVVTYVKEANKSYTNFNIYSFERQENRPKDMYDAPDMSEVDAGDEEEGLPF